MDQEEILDNHDGVAKALHEVYVSNPQVFVISNVFTLQVGF